MTGIHATYPPPRLDVSRGFRPRFDSLARIGQLAGGGLTRLAWTPEDRRARGWFLRQAARLQLRPETDRNGNLWAWWGEPGPGAIATGSHLDTVPRGGAYDGALGVVAGFLAVEALMQAKVAPARPLAVAAFTDEEGARFGTPTLGSRLMVGKLDPHTVLLRQDAKGTTMQDSMQRAGVTPSELGKDEGRAANLSAFVELHIEQGRELSELASPVAMASSVWPHGRWRLILVGEPNHAGTTQMNDRRDPMQVAAAAIEGARRVALELHTLATMGKIEVDPNGSNSIPGMVTVWLDLRASSDSAIDRAIADWTHLVRNASEFSQSEVAARVRIPK